MKDEKADVNGLAKGDSINGEGPDGKPEDKLAGIARPGPSGLLAPVGHPVNGQAAKSLQRPSLALPSLAAQGLTGLAGLAGPAPYRTFRYTPPSTYHQAYGQQTVSH